MTETKPRSAIITGASSGIGRATALQLAGAGFAVALAARRADRLESLEKEIAKKGGRAIVVPTDVTDRAAVGRLADKTREAFGSIDVVVANAGLMPLSRMSALHEDEWRRMVDVNLNGVLHTVAATLPAMLKQRRGHLVVVSSVAGRTVFAGGAVYCATKFAVRALAEGLRQELSPKTGIRVTTIEPGAVDTELPDTITDDKVREAMKPLEEMEKLTDHDIADAIVWAVTRPQRVNVNEVLIRPTQQPM